jgi:hypothetical protein
MSNKDIPVQEIGELFDTIIEKLPRVFNALRESIYSAEAGKDMGDAVGSFYKGLVDKGVPENKAMELTMEYLETLKSIANMGASRK